MSAAQRLGFSIVVGVVLGWLIFSAIPHPPFVWFGWLGIPVGGLCAWLVVDLKKVANALSLTWHQMRSQQIDRQAVRERGQMILLALKAWLTVWASCLVLLWGLGILSGPGKGQTLAARHWGLFWWSVGFGAFLFLLFIWMGFIGRRPSQYKGDPKDSGEYFLRKCFSWNPYKIYIWGLLWKGLCYYFLWRFIVRLLFWECIIGIVILRFPAYMSWLGRFIWQVYIKLHERSRTIAWVVTVLVTSILYLIKLTTHSLPFWTLPVGAVVGYLLGLTEYEVVAKKWLHVVPVNGH